LAKSVFTKGCPFSLITRPDHTHHAFLAATFLQMGNAVAAAAHTAAVLKHEPKSSLAVFMATQHCKREADRKRNEAGLLKAVLPVCPDEAPARNALEGADRPRRYGDLKEISRFRCWHV
jgi:hypothetical protein